MISAVVLGGTSLMGGRGSIIGSVLGAILLVVIDNGLNLINASVYIYDVVKGAILIAAVAVDVLMLRRLARRGGEAGGRAAAEAAAERRPTTNDGGPPIQSRSHRTA